MKRVNLGLQGGGSHGAFAWGVLDRLLADERIEFEAVTGASAGAMNAVVLAQGLANGSREEARQTLRAFWRGVSEMARHSPLRRSPVDRLLGDWGMRFSPAFTFFDIAARLASPYQFNPFGLNPLREFLERLVDFEKVRANEHLKVFVSATNVETGRARVFRTEELTAEHLLASACLPSLFHAVEIDGAPYWDGGYMGNPPLWPLFDNSTADDTIIVQINPFRRPGAPRQPRDIDDRLKEIVFNASLMRELRTIDFVTRLLDAGRLEGTGYRRVLIHMIGDEDKLSALGASSKLNVETEFIEKLFEDGVGAADAWLRDNFDSIGERSTLDLRAVFQGEEDALDGERVERVANYRNERPDGGPARARGES